MFSIILDDYRIKLSQLFLQSVSQNNYYIFISRSNKWESEEYIGTQTTDSNPPVALDSLEKVNSLYSNMIAMKKLESSDVFKVVRKIAWVANRQYDCYAHNYSAANPTPTGSISLNDSNFYVINSLFQVFKCIHNNKSPENPNGTNTGVGAEPIVTGSPTAIITTSDGYKWKFLYQISPEEILNFSTAEFIPVKTDPIVSAAAVNGNISQVNIKNRGTNLIAGTYYAKISGDGTGGVVEILIPNDVQDSFNKKVKSVNIISGGQNYNIASINLANVYSDIGLQVPTTCGISTFDVSYFDVIIPPLGGHGALPERELGSYRVLINGVLDSIDGAGDIPIGVSFRQFGLIVDPNYYNTNNAVYTLPSANTTYSLKLPSTFTGVVLSGAVMTQANTNAVGSVISYNPTLKIVRYLPKNNTNNNVVKFAGNNNITIDPTTNGGNASNFIVDATTTGSGVYLGSTFVTGYSNPEVDVRSGTIIYYENRVPVNRSLDQIENVKLVVEF